MSTTDQFDICIIGAGVVGLAVAWKLSQNPVFANRSIVVLEKNAGFGEETSSRNSEVIHAGIYYPQDSLKTRLCIEGRKQLYAYCEQFNIPCRKLGKLIIARKEQQPELAALWRKAEDNGVTDLLLVSARQLAQLEPELEAVEALLSPSSGIIDSHQYMYSLLAMAENNGTLFSPLTQVTAIEKRPNGFRLSTQCQDSPYTFDAGQVINCAGLSAQQVAGCIDNYPGDEIPAQKLVKGSYFNLKGKSPFSHLVYPLPEKNLKGLGVHVTLDMAGQARFGPDAETVTDIDYAVDQNRESLFRAAIATYYPGISTREIHPGYSGIRPKLAGDGGVADFVIRDDADHGYEGLVQLFGIESPGLTASLAIADAVLSCLQK